jgi:torulene dioxygenase
MVPSKQPEDPMTTANNNVVVALDYPGVKNPEVITILTDANRLVDLDWKTLEPKALYTYAKFNSKIGGMLSAAHPSIDAIKKETWQFTTELGRKPGYNIIVVSDEAPEGELVAFLDAKPAYIHSSFITEHYFILAVPPVRKLDQNLSFYYAPIC